MHVYMAECSHIYAHIGAQEVHKKPSWCIHSQEAGACYTKLTQLWCSTPKFYAQGNSTSLTTLPYNKTAE